MDIATVLEEYLADISSLPADLAFILDEIKVKDEKLVETQRQIQQKDGAIQKFVKSSGAMQEYPKEQALYPRIRGDFQECISLQQDKTQLAIMGLYLVTKHVSKLNSHVAKLEAEGQLAPVFESEESLLGASVSPEPPARPRKSMSESSSRRISRSESVRDKTPTDARQGSHSRASSVATGAASSITNRQSSSVSLPQHGGSSTGSLPRNGSIADSIKAGLHDDGQRQALEVNGARLSLKRNHQSPRQRPPGMEERDEAFCFCKKGSVGNMIACDGDSCEIEWFHWDCVGLTEDPKGSWYCPQCKEKIKKQAK